MTRADTFDEQALKGVIADALAKSRRRSQGLTVDTLDEHDLVGQHSPLMSPLVWDLAHVGNYEELWLLRGVAGMTPMRPEIDHALRRLRAPACGPSRAAAAGPGRGARPTSGGAPQGARLPGRTCGSTRPTRCCATDSSTAW